MSARIGERVMNGIKLLLLLMASAQVKAGTESDFGWAVNDKDGALEYIVQINPDKKRAMEQRSVAFPNGQENVSDMPAELVGRASRVVVRFGTEILPREPSLQELERMPRLFSQPNSSAAAMLGEGKLRDLESPVRNIQGQGSASVFPALPNGLPGAQGEAGSLIDQVGNAANSLRNDFGERLSDAMPDPGLLAQNMANQSGAASSFLNEARGGAAGAGSRFSNTAQPANSPLNTAANPQANAPAKLPEYPPTTGANSPFASTNQAPTNSANNRNFGLGNGLGTSNTTNPLYPADRLNPPSLNTQTTLPQQRTPSSTFGTSPGLAAQPSSEWNNSMNPNAPSYSPSMSQPQDNYTYGGSPNYSPNYPSAPNLGAAQNPTRITMNNTPYDTPKDTTLTRRQTNGGSLLPPNQMEVALAVHEKLDKNNDGQLTADEYTPANVDGILLTLFVVSLLVNLYLGHLIRKLLMRYRVVLTNVRSQAAYT